LRHRAASWLFVPESRGRDEKSDDGIQVAFSFEQGAVFHAVEQMPIAKARTHVERAEARFTKLAQEGLARFVETLGGA
jgi:hypothetical protein